MLKVPPDSGALALNRSVTAASDAVRAADSVYGGERGEPDVPMEVTMSKHSHFKDKKSSIKK